VLYKKEKKKLKKEQPWLHQPSLNYLASLASPHGNTCLDLPEGKPKSTHNEWFLCIMQLD